MVCVSSPTFFAVSLPLALMVAYSSPSTMDQITVRSVRLGSFATEVVRVREVPARMVTGAFRMSRYVAARIKRMVTLAYLPVSSAAVAVTVILPVLPLVPGTITSSSPEGVTVHRPLGSLTFQVTFCLAPVGSAIALTVMPSASAPSFRSKIYPPAGISSSPSTYRVILVVLGIRVTVKS